MLAFEQITNGTFDGVQDLFFPDTWGELWVVAAAAAGAGGAQAAPGFMDFIPLMVMIWLVMYFMVIRPQKKQTRQQDEMIESLAKHCEVRTVGGIIGKVALVDRDQGYVTIVIDESKGVRMRVALTSIATVNSDSETNDTPSTIKEEETTK